MSRNNSMSNDKSEFTSDRKLHHIDIVLNEDVTARVSTSLDEIILIHDCVPEIELDEIDTSIKILGKRLDLPLLISSMTGGHPKTKKINEILAMVAEEMNIAMGVGSQRAAIEDSSLVDTFSITRKVAPNALLLANIGAPQLALGYGIEEARACVDMIDADGLFVHFNPLQEAIQPEGDTNYKNVLNSLEDLVKGLDVPVIPKETGAGMSYEAIKKFLNVGIKWVDISGLGGTSWSAVETFRAKLQNANLNVELGMRFWNWGIPTAISILEARLAGARVFASGGIKTGLDVAKSIAIGADIAGMAGPFIKAYAKGGKKEIERLVEAIRVELKTTMFLVGAKNIEELKRVPIIFGSKIISWLNQRFGDDILEKILKVLNKPKKTLY